MSRRILRSSPPAVWPAELRELAARRRRRIAQTLAAAARDGWDVADLLAGACREAAVELDGIHNDVGTIYRGDDALVAGRPGSWESEHLRGLAGGWEHDRRQH